MAALTEIGKKLLISAIFHDFQGFETRSEVSEAEKERLWGDPRAEMQPGGVAELRGLAIKHQGTRRCLTAG